MISLCRQGWAEADHGRQAHLGVQDPLSAPSQHTASPGWHSPEAAPTAGTSGQHLSHCLKQLLSVLLAITIIIAAYCLPCRVFTDYHSHYRMLLSIDYLPHYAFGIRIKVFCLS